MRGISLIGLILFLRPHLAYTEKVPVKNIGTSFTINGDKLTWPDGPFTGSLTCTGPTKVLSLSSCQRYGTCCPPGTTLKGSPDTEWHCCGKGHDVTGSKNVGYECCLWGSTFDGNSCQREEVCHNGKHLIGGKCQCPSGHEEAADGTCKPARCQSGIESGKCYFLKGRSGNYLTFNNQYSELELNPYVRPSKFQFCRNEKCTPGLPINPTHEFYMKDLHGLLPEATDAGLWIDNTNNGGYIGKTYDFANAGNFLITKWPGGRYCLTGFSEGLAQAYPDVLPGLSFNSRAPDACIEFELTEVPCNIRDDANNCIWGNGERCGPKPVHHSVV
ncbi:uncharacterized protein N7518_002280 [Penicillium psychrosexuale]|uniref:uncharacterized protein n=1 Tax=Penicillium psychrosexuale TaxID=1002107 RepID=UPI0025450D91|nr:uncharacterized protein N7518_002280 [Penicillium psychrosexuale]KAJ5800212.1 hypothetical protein N7518_002280 [Penicillium psychrosexuale]